MLGLLIFLGIVGIIGTVIGRLQQYGSDKATAEATEADLEAQQIIDAQAAALLEDQREALLEQAKTDAKLLRDQAAFAADQAGLLREEIGVSMTETAIKLAGLGDQAAASLATQTAGTSAGGFAPGASFKAVRARFERGVNTAASSTKLRGDIAVKRGELGVLGQELAATQLEIKAEQTLDQADLNAEALRIQQEATLAGIDSAERHLDLLEIQQNAFVPNLVANILTDTVNTGLSFATSGLFKFPNTQATDYNIRPFVNAGFGVPAF